MPAEQKSSNEIIEVPNEKSIFTPELLVTLEFTKSISWQLYVDTDTIVFSDNFEALYGIHQPDYNYKFERFIDQHVVNPNKDKIFESIDLYYSGESDIAEISDLSIFDDKHMQNWVHAKAKCINGNARVLYGVSVDITNQMEPNQIFERTKDKSGFKMLMPELSRREQEVIEALLDGNVSYKELSDALCISLHTVKTHLRHIYQIADVPNITSLLSYLHS